MSEKKRILVADDEELVRTSLSRDLAGEGYEVVMAKDGDEAVALLRKEKFDLAILDLLMPRLGGFEVLKFISTEFPSVRSIMLTAYGDIAHAIECKKYGAEDFISKPYEVFDLLNSVERALSK